MSFADLILENSRRAAVAKFGAPRWRVKKYRYRFRVSDLPVALWMAYPQDHPGQTEEFSTHAQAIAYADKKARS